MATENKSGNKAASASVSGAFWFAGWLFTIAYSNLVWWKILLAIIIWPYYLGQAAG